MAIVGVPLAAVFALRGDTNALYVLLLIAVSLGLLVWAWPRVLLGLTAVLLYTQPLLIYLGNTEYGYTKAVYSLGVISLLLVIWTGRWALRGRGELQLTPLSAPGLVVLVAALLSLTHSRDFWANFQYVVLFVYFGAFGLLVANELRDRRDVAFLLIALLLSAFLAAGYGLLQYYGVLPGAPGAKWTGAIISTFGNKNYLAGFLSYLVAPGLALLLVRERPWERGLIAGALGVIYVTLVACASDSAWLAVIASLGALFVGLGLVGQLGRLGREWPWVVGVVGLSLALTAALGATSPAWVRRGYSELGWVALAATLALPALAWAVRQFAQLPKRTRGLAVGAALALIAVGLMTPWGRGLVQDVWRYVETNSARVRAWDWWVAYEIWKDHPIVGTGLGDYKREFLPYKGRFLETPRGQAYKERVGYILRAAQAHNEYVQMLAELGLVGALGIVLFLIALGWTAWRRLRALRLHQKIPESVLLVGLLGGIVAFLSDSVFSFPLHLPANALAFVFLLGALCSRALGEPWGVVRLGRAGSRALALIVLLVAVTVSAFAYRDWMADRALDSAKIYLHTLGDLRTAEYLLQRSVAWDFAPGEAYYHLAMIALQRGDLRRAKELLERSVRVFVTERSYYYLAQISLQLEEIDDAARYVDELLGMDPAPDLKPDAWYVKALVSYKQGKPEEALEWLRKVIEKRPKEAKAYLNIGEIYVELRRFEEARPLLRRALVLLDEQLQELQEQLAAPELPPGMRELARAQQQELERLKRRAEELLQALP